ncbi:MAG: FAD:protein FMN transferase [Dehalococcoidia bacterium]
MNRCATPLESGRVPDVEARRFRRSAVFMDTVVTIDIIDPPAAEAAEAAVERAFRWFQHVEATCSRFDPASELSRLSATVDEPIVVSPLLFEVVRFALSVAETTGGAFDPTVGRALESAGFDRNFRTGAAVRSPGHAGETPASYRDVILDAAGPTVCLRRSLVLDLGGVAKGFAVDLAARELEAYPHCSINAGGDILVRGLNEAHEPWRVGIRDPRAPERLIDVIAVTGRSVCTSGDYERRGPGGEGHILDPRTGGGASRLASVTVIAETTMLADALATAAFVLGPERGLELLAEQGVEGAVVLASGSYLATGGFARFRA